ncbi:MAG TPA: 3-isopropylmalate dehydratase small subunit [Chloroflexota bacterium]
MRPFTCHTGLVLPLDRSNVDTDQIIPKQFLKRIERTGFGQFLFFDWRYDSNGEPKPDFDLNEERYQGASILVAGRNFGCGSSREHAVWALDDFGFRAVIAQSFADIFHSNALGNGLLPVRLSEDQVNDLLRRAQQTNGYTLTVDLERCSVTDSQGFEASFEMDPFDRRRLLEGLDDIGLTLRHEDAIAEFERKQALLSV